jgi:YfiH family protein
MELTTINQYKFFHYYEGAFNIMFFTAENDKSFNINSEEGIENINELKNLFKLDDIGYCRQIHSDIVWNYNGDIKQGDSIITNLENVGLGVFTADCVPVILYDEKNKAIAAVHSGWKGTYEEIVSKTVEKMTKCYETKPENLRVFIGPHIRECCYQVGNEVVEKFQSKGYKLDEI